MNRSKITIFSLLAMVAVLATACFEFENQDILSDVIIVKLSNTAAEASSRIIDSTGQVTRFGHVWSEFTNPEIFRPGVEQTEFRVVDFEQGEFKSIMNNLLPNRTYFVRAYMIINENLNTPIYSNQVSFVTDGVLNKPDNIINLLGTADIKDTTARALGKIEKLAASAQVLEFGHVWSTEELPDTSNLRTTFTSPPVNDEYASTLEDLQPDTEYFVRAYMVVELSGEPSQLIYSSGQLSFTTTNN